MICSESIIILPSKASGSTVEIELSIKAIVTLPLAIPPNWNALIVENSLFEIVIPSKYGKSANASEKQEIKIQSIFQIGFDLQGSMLSIKAP